MTPKQVEQWNKFACVPRSLLKLSEMNGRRLSRDQFCERFANVFVDREHQLGLLTDEGFDSSIAGLELGKSAQQSNDYCTILRAFNDEQRKVLILSKINLAPGANDDVNH